MATTRKTLITLVFTILFLESSFHCRSIASALTPDNGLYLNPNFEYFN